MPEPGRVSSRVAAALAGDAPYDDKSGTRELPAIRHGYEIMQVTQVHCRYTYLVFAYTFDKIVIFYLTSNLLYGLPHTNLTGGDNE